MADDSLFSGEDEEAAMKLLLESHPQWGRRAISIAMCIKSRAVPACVKTTYRAIYKARYGSDIMLEPTT